jgi:hypothetical protein
MLIKKCKKCGVFIHDIDSCFSCGNSKEFEHIEFETVVHSNVNNEYTKMKEFIAKRKYTQALELSQYILELSPTCSDVFWLRLLAKNSCRNDMELIRHGFAFKEDADYFNAVLYASDDQRNVYENVASKVEALQKTLINYLLRSKYTQRLETRIFDYQKDFSNQLEKHKRCLQDLWTQIKSVEDDMKVIEIKCSQLSKEHEILLKYSYDKASSIEQKLRKETCCTTEKLNDYQMRLVSLVNISQHAKAEIDNMRNVHPWVHEYQKLGKERDRLETEIKVQINSFNNSKTKFEEVLNTIKGIDSRHETLQKDVLSYNFSSTQKSLGDSLFEQAYTESIFKKRR